MEKARIIMKAAVRTVWVRGAVLAAFGLSSLVWWALIDLIRALVFAG